LARPAPRRDADDAAIRCARGSRRTGREGGESYRPAPRRDGAADTPGGLSLGEARPVGSVRPGLSGPAPAPSRRVTVQPFSRSAVQPFSRSRRLAEELRAINGGLRPSTNEKEAQMLADSLYQGSCGCVTPPSSLDHEQVL